MGQSRGLGAKVEPLAPGNIQAGDPHTSMHELSMSVNTQAMWFNLTPTRRTLAWLDPNYAPLSSNTGINMDIPFVGQNANAEVWTGTTSGAGAGGGTTAVFAASTFTTNEYQGYFAYIESRGVRKILSNTTTTLTFSDGFSAQVAGSTVVQIQGGPVLQIPWLAHPNATGLLINMTLMVDPVDQVDLSTKIRTQGAVIPAAEASSFRSNTYTSLTPAIEPLWNSRDRTINAPKLVLAQARVSVDPTYPADNIIVIEPYVRWEATEDPYGGLFETVRRVYLKSINITDIIAFPEPIA